MCICEYTHTCIHIHSYIYMYVCVCSLYMLTYTYIYKCEYIYTSHKILALICIDTTKLILVANPDLVMYKRESLSKHLGNSFELSTKIDEVIGLIIKTIGDLYCVVELCPS